MHMLEQMERHARRWTVDEMGRHAQFGDLLDEVAEALQADYGLFTLEEVSERLMEQLDQHLLKTSGEEDRKTVPVKDVREALQKAGL